jgi:hypothetical protein
MGNPMRACGEVTQFWDFELRKTKNAPLDIFLLEAKNQITSLMGHQF